MATAEIKYREIDTPIGIFILGASDKGCSISEFADRGGFEKINHRIQKRFNAELIPGNNQFIDHLEEEFNLYFQKKLKTFTVPLDFKGTPFQESVWTELLKIPYGETRSYGSIAKQLGKPGAMRAVGKANGDNYLPIVIPCHRVIDASGKLHGYGGGLWRKKYLLELESNNLNLFKL
jgi:AraC family transcriptional regulator, regulatory protein of adaptative response / methylated-DNA-[protein]-cysteine methyltransferase